MTIVHIFKNVIKAVLLFILKRNYEAKISNNTFKSIHFTVVLVYIIKNFPKLHFK